MSDRKQQEAGMGWGPGDLPPEGFCMELLELHRGDLNTTDAEHPEGSLQEAPV